LKALVGQDGGKIKAEATYPAWVRIIKKALEKKES
jgi:hypothetical protein